MALVRGAGSGDGGELMPRNTREERAAYMREYRKRVGNKHTKIQKELYRLAAEYVRNNHLAVWDELSSRAKAKVESAATP